ncbi:MAG TPA: hypothetical protein VG738_23505 [Chitinophagaceae bacterium]|nr:hypothetical protein [Chitinophagaceae bacterium]
MQVFFIDRFIMPVASKEAFLQRANINRSLIKTLPGFVEDNFYEQYSDGQYRCVTVAVWQDEQAIANARSVVTEEYKRQGFDMPAMMKQLNIQMERGVYNRLAE